MRLVNSRLALEFKLPSDLLAAATQPLTAGIVLTFPLLSGKVEAWRRFCQELAGSRRNVYTLSRRRLGVTREQMTLRDSPLGSVATTTLQAPDLPRVLGELILSTLPFESWYRERLQDLHGIQLTGCVPYRTAAELIQARELLFDWRAAGLAAGPGGVDDPVPAVRQYGRHAHQHG